MKNSPIAGKQLSFKATLENWAEGMDYCAVPVPARITEALASRAAVLVLAVLNDSEPFKVSLFPVGGGKHYIRVRATIRKATGTKVGDRVRIRFTVLDRAALTYPSDLASALRAAAATSGFNALPPGRQQYLIRRIDDAVKPDTRQKRIGEAVKEGQRYAVKRVKPASSSS